LASLLAPSSAFPFTSKGHPLHNPPPPQATHPSGLPRLSSCLDSRVGWRASASACATLA
jgi:hypothetical protein